MMSFAGVVTFDADADKGNASTDANNAAAYTITKGGVTVEVSSGILGTYNNEMHYRIYKNQTLKITSTAGNITSVEFTCTANGDTKYGPGCFTVDGGDYTYAEAVGTWTGSATEITFTAATNQVRATQIVVTIDGEVGETPEQPEEPETPETPENPGTTTIEIPAEAQAWNIPAEAIDVLQAREICAGLASGETYFAPTSHPYFNLSGFKNSVESVLLKVNAQKYTVKGESGLPNGKIEPIKNTPYNFGEFKELGTYDFDVNFCAEGEHKATAIDKNSNLQLDVYSNLKGLQLYTPNFTKTVYGKQRLEYNGRCAFCLEPQFYPNAVNISEFTKPLIKKGEQKEYYINYFVTEV